MKQVYPLTLANSDIVL